MKPRESKYFTKPKKSLKPRSQNISLTTRGVGVITYTLLSGGVSPFWGGNRYRTMAKVVFFYDLFIVFPFLFFLSCLISWFLIFPHIAFSYLLLSCPFLSYLFKSLPRSCTLFIFSDPLLRLHPGPSQLRARVRCREGLHQEAAGAQPLREAHSGPGLTTSLADRQQGTF